MATIKEVAAAAGVTPTTVTNVLRGKGRVSEQTRQRVLDAVAASGYRPNLTARALVEQKAPTLALMLGCITNPFYPEFSLHAHMAARRSGRFLLVCNTDHEVDGGEQFLQEVAGSLSDGVLVANKGDLDVTQLLAFEKQGIPVVISVWEFPDVHPGVPCIAFDSRLAGILAAEHLVDLGHRKIGALIASPLDGIHSGRYQGLLSVLDAHGLTLLPDNLLTCVDSFEDGYAMGKALLLRHPDITALFVSNDLPALGVIDAAVDLGIKVPEQLSVVSITNISLTAQCRPSLTTVAIPTREMAEQGVEMLLRLFEEKPAQPPMVTLPNLTLIPRQSTAAPSEQTISSRVASEAAYSTVED